MIRHASLFFLLISLCFTCTGCIVLPIPHVRLHAYGVKGRVADADSGLSVPKAFISADASAHREIPVKEVSCNADGGFTVSPEYGWHAAYLFGVVSFSLCPDFDLIAPRRSFTVSAPGYNPACITVTPGPDDPSDANVPARRSGDYLEAALIKLKPQR